MLKYVTPRMMSSVVCARLLYYNAQLSTNENPILTTENTQWNIFQIFAGKDIDHVIISC